jgi:hypothetical protein
LLNESFNGSVGIPGPLHGRLVANECLRSELAVSLEKIGKELLEAFVGKANMSVALGPEVNWFNGVNKLLLEGVVNVSVFTVLTDGLAQDCGGGA